MYQWLKFWQVSSLQWTRQYLEHQAMLRDSMLSFIAADPKRRDPSGIIRLALR